jgi:hypothetical protein
MKLTASNQIGIRFKTAPLYKREITRVHHAQILDRISNPDDKSDAVNRFSNLISSQDNKFYVYSNKAIAVTNSIFVDSKTEPSFFDGLRVGKKVTILLGNEFYRYQVLNGTIMCLYGQEQNEDTIPEFTYTCFSIYTDSRNTYSFPDNRLNPFDDLRFRRLIQMLIFLEFSEVTTQELGQGKKTGTKKTGKVLNQTNNNLIFVDSTWNVEYSSKGEVLVSGHFRLQKVGAGRKEIKRIYIEPFKKGEYTRRSKAEINE